ncbi:MAG: RdgB/HAM1 family non-canonical purine NTP pyrophosphatase [Puniceicoccales bacterium]|jgi:XTP/dITP diphosphohydrolase|nr:RdgB/HAM1 family non-canonical purine NTP pyrophosphatase [Puniceicoccales bacterium]
MGSEPPLFIIATGNAHKAAEFAQLFAIHGVNARVCSAAETVGMPHVLEDANSFHDNALKKAAAVRAIAPPEAWVLADDSGLLCDALNGAPGIHSARYAGEGQPDSAHRAKLLDVLRGMDGPMRRAHFFCQLVVLAADGREQSFCGICPGKILRTEIGTGGFGYDPIFQPDEFDCNFAELTLDEKNRHSHRGRAFTAMVCALKKDLQ